MWWRGVKFGVKYWSLRRVRKVLVYEEDVSSIERLVI